MFSNILGADGSWSGGSCSPVVCAQSRLQHSHTVCSGVVGDVCGFDCRRGAGATVSLLRLVHIIARKYERLNKYERLKI